MWKGHQTWRPHMTLLALDIVEAILDGRQPAAMTLAVLIRPFPVGWTMAVV